MRAKLMQWLHTHVPRLHVVGEFDDSAMIKAFGESGWARMSRHRHVPDRESIGCPTEPYGMPLRLVCNIKAVFQRCLMNT